MKFIIVLLTCCSFSVFAQQARIFPQPNQLIETPGDFNFNGQLTVQNAPLFLEVAPYLQQLFAREKGIELTTSATNFSVSLQQNSQLPKEAYQLKINQSGVFIQFADKNGLLYAFQSLQQWMTNKQTIKGVQINDVPRFSYRGTHLDCARHFYTIAELKQFIDELALLKFNRFHWHLTDDQGWRLEIVQFPKLTAIGAWRDSTIIGHYSANPRVYEKKRYGGSYTQEEAKELVQYAAIRGITIVPEIELPGHARAALAAYPELGCTGEQLPVPGLWGVFDDVFCPTDETLDFLKKVLDEVVAIFPSETIHIGGDEVPKTRWNNCDKCKHQREAHGLKDAHELQSYVISQMEQHLRAKGRKIIGWDEILEGGLADNAQVMSWRGVDGGIAAAKAKHHVVMSPVSHCYFDYYQSSHADEPLAIGGLLTLEKVYSYEPIPKELSKEEAAFILGAQANIWTEYLPEFKDVQYNTFPRLIAMAQVNWTNIKPSYESFVEEMNRWYLPQLNARGVNYSRAFLDPNLTIIETNNGLDLKANVPLSGVDLKYGDQSFEALPLERTATKIIRVFPITTWYQGKEHRTANFSYWTHLATGRKVTFQTLPDEKYNYHGDLALTDGVVGGTPWRGDQWLGFLNDTVVFTLDLAAATDFKQLEMGMLNEPNSWIYRPQSVLIEISSDGKKFKTYKKQQITTDKLDITQQATARFIRVTLINLPLIPEGDPGAGYIPWTFVDELIITR